MYADAGSYFDISLTIYKAADHRNLSDIKLTWTQLIEKTHNETLENKELQPYEAISEQVRTLGRRLQLAENTFPIRPYPLFFSFPSYLPIKPI